MGIENKTTLTGRSWRVRTVVVLVADGVEEAAQKPRKPIRTVALSATPTEHEVKETSRERPIPLVDSA